MIARPILALAAAATAANAFMIPSTVSLPDVKDEGFAAFRHHLDIQDLKNPETSLSLPCTGCQFPDANKNNEMSADIESELVFTFRLSDDVLDLNQQPIYPISEEPLPVMLAVHREHVRFHSSRELLESAPNPVSGGFKRNGLVSKVVPSVSVGETGASDGSSEQLIDVRVFISYLDHLATIYLDDGKVSGFLPNHFDVQLFKDSEGHLNLHHLRTDGRKGLSRVGDFHTRPSPAEICGMGSLSAFLCRARLFVDRKFMSLAGRKSGCQGAREHHGHGAEMSEDAPYDPARGHHVDTPSVHVHSDPSKHSHGLAHIEHNHNTVVKPEGEAAPSYDGPSDRHHHIHHSGPHAWGHHNPHQRHQHGSSGFGSTIRYIVLRFLVPVLVGVAAGMTASLLGMMVGTAIAWCWIRFVRGNKKGSANGRDEKVALMEETAGLDRDEKKGLLMIEELEEEALPVYAEKE